MWWHKRESQEISALDEKIEKLRRDFQSLEMEWTNFFDKARRLLQRITKRAEVVEKAEATEMQEGQTQEARPLLLASSGNSIAGRLTDRQKEIQQQILRRRARGA